MIGKTIARVIERPTDREHGYERDDTLLIVFTDGTALEVSGSSYEEVSLGWAERTAEDVRAYEQAAAGRREAERVKRLEAEALRAMTCEERTERKRAREERMGAEGRAFANFEQSMLLDMMRDANRTLFGVGDDLDKTIKGFCPNCGAQYCENAPDVPVYSQRGGLFCKTGEITIPIRDNTSRGER